MPASSAPRGPAAALAELLHGNRRFLSGQPLHGHDVTAAEAAASGDQQPYAVVVGCMDSRVPLEAIFDQTFGSICVVRSGAHVLDRAVVGSVEFATCVQITSLVAGGVHKAFNEEWWFDRDRGGGILNASTDREITVYWCKVPQPHFGLAVDLLSRGDTGFNGIVTHTVPLEDIESGFDTAYDKSTGSLKVHVTV